MAWWVQKYKRLFFTKKKKNKNKKKKTRKKQFELDFQISLKIFSLITLQFLKILLKLGKMLELYLYGWTDRRIFKEL